MIFSLLTPVKEAACFCLFFKITLVEKGFIYLLGYGSLQFIRDLPFRAEFSACLELKKFENFFNKSLHLQLKNIYISILQNKNLSPKAFQLIIFLYFNYKK